MAAYPLAVSEAFSATLLLGAVGLVGAAEAELAVAAAAMALVNCVPEVPLPPRLSQNRADPLQRDHLKGSGHRPSCLLYGSFSIFSRPDTTDSGYNPKTLNEHSRSRGVLLGSFKGLDPLDGCYI